MTAGTGTLAYFQDTETSTGNIFTVGTMDLKVQDVDTDPWTDGVTASWTLPNMMPGDQVYGHVDVDNIGSIDADHLEITCDYAVTEEVPQTESDTDPNTDLDPDWMAKHITITYAQYHDGDDDIDLLTGKNACDSCYNADWEIEDVDLDGRITLYDLKNDELDNLPAPDTIEQYTLKMTVKFDETAGNDFQGDTLTVTLTFTLNQDSSQ